MDRIVGPPGPPPGDVLPVEEVVTRVALLSGLGGRARALGAEAARVTARAGGRTCLDAGGPVQVLLDAHGPRALRLGLATGPGFSAEILEGWASEADRMALATVARGWEHDGWTVWGPEGLDWYADVRGALDVEARAGGGELPPSAASHGTPWALHVEVRGGRVRTELQWLLRREAPTHAVLDALAPGGAAAATALFEPLMGPTLRVARWVVGIGVGAPTGFSFGCGRWSLVPEDEAKHAAIVRVVRAHGGAESYAGAVWSLLRGLSGEGWRVGRGLEGRVGDSPARLRLILVPAAARPGSGA